MMYIIMVIVAIFLLMLGLASYKSFIVKGAGNKENKIDFKSGTKGIAGKMWWALIGTFTFIYVISLIIPIIWLFLTSVKDVIQFERNNFGFPTEWHFENYLIAIQRFEVRQGLISYRMFEMLLNSIIYACGQPLVVVFWTYLVAYVMARFEWVGNKMLYNLGIFMMTVTLVGSGASAMILYQKLGLYDNMYLAISLPPATAFSGLYFMMIHSSCKGISSAYSEAARIDGAGEYTIMFRIIFPMVLPTLCTIYVLWFIGAWNNYSSFLVYFPSTPNLAYGLYLFQQTAQSGSNGLDMPQVLAAIVVVMIPSVVLYLCTQGIIKSNFVVGGIKG